MWQLVPPDAISVAVIRPFYIMNVGNIFCVCKSLALALTYKLCSWWRWRFCSCCIELKSFHYINCIAKIGLKLKWSMVEHSCQILPASYRLCGIVWRMTGPRSLGPACFIKQYEAGCQLLACRILAAPYLSKRKKGPPYSYITVIHSSVYWTEAW